MNASQISLSDLGEKALIREFIKPFFNSNDDPAGVGDDCAMVPCGEDLILLSTDRVPSDLTAFKLGILDYHGLGDYLARLNLSDVAACGGRAVGLLLNLGLPDHISFDQVRALCTGFRDRAERHQATVLGGDVTSCGELSISATSIGKVRRECVLTRRGAKPGDSIFVSRPLGVTPAAFRAFAMDGFYRLLSADFVSLLERQFTSMDPMLPLGIALGKSGRFGACMDNTDGIGQSLFELAEASRCALIVDHTSLRVPDVVRAVSELANADPLELLFGAGADFSLVGTLRGLWSDEDASMAFQQPIQIIGRVDTGEGVWFENGQPLTFHGWNYFRR
jgi:thiamine-monophosphate kinase